MTEEGIKKKVSNKKNDRYKADQLLVVEKLNQILGINESNNKFILEELNSDEEKQKKIIGLEEDVKKYFLYGNWGYFKKLVANESMSLVRSIYKNTGYEMQYKKRIINGIMKTEYSINKKLQDISKKNKNYVKNGKYILYI